MIAKPEYVKQLMRKRFEKTLAEKEKGQLAAARLIYTEDEWWEMISEVLIKMDEENPIPPLEDEWRPPIFEKLQKQERRREELKKRRIPVLGAVVLLLGLFALFMYISFPKVKPGMIGECRDVSESMSVPAGLQSSTIMLPDSTIFSSTSLKADSVINLYKMQARQSRQGILELTATPGRLSVDSVNSPAVEVHTKAKQQYTVILPNKTSILLNAGSILKIAYKPLDSLYYLFLVGEALVKIPEQVESTHQRVIVETPNAQIQSASGSFAILAMSGYNQTTLLEGKLVTFTREGAQTKQLNKPGEQVLISTYKLIPDVLVDSVKYSCRKANIAQAIVWTKAIRYYNDVPLRQFVADLCQWYGVKVNNINCVPENKRITAAFCYQVPPDTLYALIRAKGIAVHEDHGVLTFCDPPAEKMPWAKVATPMPYRPAMISGERSPEL
jgi:ferric-dicitrate binding protein FerR (iron transport regulator)